MDAQDVKVKSLQLDMIKEVSSMLKIAASMEDENAREINDIVVRLDNLVDNLDKNLCETAQTEVNRRKSSHLKLV